MNGNPCTHKGCGQPTWRQRETTTAWSDVCCYGHRAYIFLNDKGEFETPAQRMERLLRVCTCPDCGAEHTRYDGMTQTTIKCDDCREKMNRDYMLKKSRSDYAKVKAKKAEREDQSKGSDWHLFRHGGF